MSSLFLLVLLVPILLMTEFALMLKVAQEGNVFATAYLALAFALTLLALGLLVDAWEKVRK